MERIRPEGEPHYWVPEYSYEELEKKFKRAIEIGLTLAKQRAEQFGEQDFIQELKSLNEEND